MSMPTGSSTNTRPNCCVPLTLPPFRRLTDTCANSVVSHSWTLLRRKEEDIPKALAQLSIPAVTTRKALERLRKNASARPGNIVKAAIQQQLHRDYTFQGSDGLESAAKMLGIKDFWTKVREQITGYDHNAALIQALNDIVVRRNQIVHEADLVRKTRSAVDTVREIDRGHSRFVVAFVPDLVGAIDRVAEAEFASG
jgi:hypothetical protein